jgi:hypothetical protein
MYDMNHTTLALVAVLAAAALAIGAFATIASPAFAGGSYGDSSKTITKQINKQKQVLSGFVTEGFQDADNCIAVLNGANACREQGTP